MTPQPKRTKPEPQASSVRPSPGRLRMRPPLVMESPMKSSLLAGSNFMGCHRLKGAPAISVEVEGKCRSA
jgi:hypothetical protein